CLRARGKSPFATFATFCKNSSPFFAYLAYFAVTPSPFVSIRVHSWLRQFHCISNRSSLARPAKFSLRARRPSLPINRGRDAFHRVPNIVFGQEGNPPSLPLLPSVKIPPPFSRIWRISRLPPPPSCPFVSIRG